MVLRCLFIERPNRTFLRLEARYDASFLSADELHRYAADPVYDLSEAFVGRALSMGHRCLAIRDGDDVLASYGWYCTTPTPFTDALWVHFNREWVYMHKGFTHPAHRGRRLHAIGMTLALTAYVARGLRGVVSIVEADNVASLTSCVRMGYRAFGTIYTARPGRLIGLRDPRGWLDRPFVLATPGCRAFGFRLARTRQGVLVPRHHGEPTTADLAFERGS